MRGPLGKVSLALALFSLLLAASPGAAGIIDNGDFENGNTGFTSAYTYRGTPEPPDLPQNYYSIVTTPRYVHSLWLDMGDHTTGTGKMMVVNGSDETGIPVWQGQLTQPLIVGGNYDFSAWVAAIYDVSYAELTFRVGDQDLGTLSPDPPVGTWTRLFATFTATEPWPVFYLINSNDDYVGNDFAVDDIAVYFAGTQIEPDSVPEPTTLTLLGLGILGFLRRKRSR